MLRNLTCTFCTALLAFAIGCSRADRQSAERNAAEAKEKTRTAAERVKQDARRLADQTKQGANSLRQDIDRALWSTEPARGGIGQSEEKLRHGTEDLRAAGNDAAVKLDRAAIIAKVKAKLATNVGLSTITGIDVDAAGQVVTLHGAVSSEQQKQQAEQAVLEVDGVKRVVDVLVVKP
jgi:osmotically-inducible protein OsmY